MKAILSYDDKPKLVPSIIFAIQHILAAFNGIIAVPLIVGGALALSTEDLSYYISCTIFSAGIATCIQAFGIWKIGAKMPVIMGTDFTFVGPSISVGKRFGLAGIFTATAIGGISEIIYSRFIEKIKKLFPPLVSSIVVSLIGLTLIPVSIDWACGGVGSVDYASIENLSLAAFTATIIIIFHIFGGKKLSTVSVFIGMVSGYILSILLGKVTFHEVIKASIINIPEPFHFGIKFDLRILPPFLIAYLVTTIETIGDLTAIAEVSGKEIKKEELERGVLADGVGSTIGGIFNAGANTSFSQNVGIIPITGIASRFVVGVAGIILIILGLFPKLSTVIALMPQPVLGGAGIIMFGMVAGAGIMNLKNVKMNSRNLLIIALSFGLGLGVVMRPEILKNFPETLKILFSSGITTGTLTAIILNLILPEK
ncbi:MAG: purine permease [Caldiserica bacterium]|nr:MAG: purine permease [Caldisericota bacterium]